MKHHSACIISCSHFCVKFSRFGVLLRRTTVLATVLGLAPLHGVLGQNLVSEGILANSGESGTGLVRFSPKPAGRKGNSEGLDPGLGVVMDRFGFLWDRGGHGMLNRYSVDGRMVGQYKIPAGAAQGDKLVISGDRLVLFLAGKLYVLDVNAAPDSSAVPLGMQADAMSFGFHDGNLALKVGEEILAYGPEGARGVLATGVGKEVNQLEVAPDGTLVLGNGSKVTMRRPGQAAAQDKLEKNSPGNRFQFLGGYWYGHTGSGTIRRFDAQMNAAPGVVLGGASGSFIGKLDGNYDIGGGRGLAQLRDGIFAISGSVGIVHILRWADNGFEIVRRIGSLPQSAGLLLDEAGNVRTGTGSWKWSDGPASPQENGSPMIMIGPGVDLPSGGQLVPGLQYGSRPRLISLSAGKIRRSFSADGEEEAFASGAVGCALVKNGADTQLLMLSPAGKLRSLKISGSGEYLKHGTDLTLTASQPVKEWTGLARVAERSLVAAADGWVIELKKSENGWSEVRRWNSWEKDRFGPQICLCWDAGRLWVADTSRHRVLCFEGMANKLQASFGTADKSGDQMGELNFPRYIAARGPRAVVFDNGNQRLVKMKLVAAP